MPVWPSSNDRKVQLRWGMPQPWERIPSARCTPVLALPSYGWKRTAVVRTQCRTFLFCATRQVSENRRRSQICLKNTETNRRKRKCGPVNQRYSPEMAGWAAEPGQPVWYLCPCPSPHPVLWPPTHRRCETGLLWSCSFLGPANPAPRGPSNLFSFLLPPFVSQQRRFCWVLSGSVLWRPAQPSLSMWGWLSLSLNQGFQPNTANWGSSSHF